MGTQLGHKTQIRPFPPLSRKHIFGMQFVEESRAVSERTYIDMFAGPARQFKRKVRPKMCFRYAWTISRGGKSSSGSYSFSTKFVWNPVPAGIKRPKMTFSLSP